jgi:ribonuclease HI
MLSLSSKLCNPPSAKELNELISDLTTLSGRVRQVVTQWVPVHCCIVGNESTDALAKEGAGKTPEDPSITYDEAKTPTKAHQITK